MPKKLSEILKKQILEGFCSGKSLTNLAKEYGYSSATITRTVKGFLTEEEYLQLKGAKGKKKELQKNHENFRNVLGDDIQPVSTSQETLNKQDVLQEGASDVVQGIDLRNEPNSLKSNDRDTDFFTEITPLNFENTWDKQKEVACTPLNPDSLPKTVYMLVDKKVELESRQLKEFSDWTFLSELDQSRLVIPLFSSQREAKRSCSKNQRVLKVPDSKVFIISSSYLLSKGITRLIIDDSLIALDS